MLFYFYIHIEGDFKKCCITQEELPQCGSRRLLGKTKTQSFFQMLHEVSVIGVAYGERRNIARNYVWKRNNLWKRDTQTLFECIFIYLYNLWY